MNWSGKSVLITGAAGFIGFHLVMRLLKENCKVVGIDNLNDYYDPELKKKRLEILTQYQDFSFHKLDIADQESLASVFGNSTFDHVVHLAAQAGVRYSIDHPATYIQSNLVGFANILEACRHARTPHLVFASSSSVYGANTRIPYSEHHGVDHPVSLYSATKRSNELMAHSYAHLFGLPVTGLRFFTVYGPWGRPDMAYFLFTKAILDNQPIKVFNHGRHQRDLTYIDDVIEGVVRVMTNPPSGDANWNSSQPDPANSSAPFRIYNIGNNNPVNLGEFIAEIEKCLGRSAEKVNVDLQPGDVANTWADCADLANDFGYEPSTSLQDGIGKFVDWYKATYMEHQ